MMTERRTDLIARIARALSIIPMVGAILLFGTIGILLFTTMYIIAYLFPIAGIIITLIGITHLSVKVILTGLFILAFGGGFYEEFFVGIGRMPTITEYIRRGVAFIKGATS